MPRKITVYDDSGQPRRIDAEHWAEDVLPGLLTEAWDDAEELAGHVLSALEGGFAERVLHAAERLVRIDERPDRATSVLALVRLRMDEIDEAEGILLRFLADHGDSALVLAHLGEICAQKGDDGQAEGLFRRALEVDPDSVFALEHWLSIQVQQHGQEGRERALLELARRPDAYWPQILLARDCLERGEVRQAEAFYDEIWERVCDEVPALVRITGDLGETGHSDLLLARIKPHWDARRLGPIVGLNLARACLEEYALAEGRAILRDVAALEVPFLTDEIVGLERDFEAAQSAGVHDPLADSGLDEVDEPLRVAVVPFEGPVWSACFSDAGPLVAAPIKAGRKIALLALSDVRAQQLGEPLQEIDVVEGGRMSRGLPLFLSESLAQTTDARSTALVPVVRGAGPILAGEPWDPDWFLSEIPEEHRPDVLMRGQITLAGVELELFDVAARTLLHKLTFRGDDKPALARRGAVTLPPLSMIEAAVRDVLERAGAVRPRPKPSPFYGDVPAGVQGLYLRALDQLHGQILLAGKLVDREVLIDEPQALRSYFDLAEAMPESRAAVLIACGGVLAGHGYGSEVVGEFKQPLLELLRRDGPGGALSRLAEHVEDRL